MLTFSTTQPLLLFLPLVSQSPHLHCSFFLEIRLLIWEPGSLLRRRSNGSLSILGFASSFLLTSNSNASWRPTQFSILLYSSANYFFSTAALYLSPCSSSQVSFVFQCRIFGAVLTYASLRWNNKHIAANNLANLFRTVTHFNSTIYHSHNEFLSNSTRSGFTSHQRRILVVPIKLVLTTEAGLAFFLSRLQLPAPSK